MPFLAMAAPQDDAHITSTLKRKREDFMHGVNMIDQMLLSYEEILNNAGVRSSFTAFNASILASVPSHEMNVALF